MKHKNPHALETALFEAVALLGGPDAAGAVIGKTGALVRKYTDPDAEGRIALSQALEIDMACKQSRGVTPINDFYCRALDGCDATEQTADAFAASFDALVSMTRLAEAIKAAKAPTGPGGHRITQAELRDIQNHLRPLQRQYAELMASLEALNDGGNIRIVGAA